MMRTLHGLIVAVHREAELAEFPVDTAVYQRSEKDPTRPILYAGSLDAPVCVFARDLGKDEVAAGEPLIGAGGRLVRAGLYEAWHGEPPRSRTGGSRGARARAADQHGPLQAAGEQGVCRVGQGAVPPVPRRAPRRAWKGDRVLTLGTEAFQWFAPYADDDVRRILEREDRYEAELPCILTCETDDGPVRKPLTLSPLPHPSPLNQRWYPLFPGLLAKRLAAVHDREA